MKVKEVLWQVAKGFYLGMLIPLIFILATALILAIWFIILKYFDFLLGVFPENMFLTITTFCATVGTIIFGGSLYVSSR